MRAIGSLVAIAVACLAPLHAQTGKAVRLAPATATLTEEFTSIGSVRELSDGRVLITDPRENRVVVADFKSGTVQQVGRKGQGPNEYGIAGTLIPLAADSSLMVDFSARRWLLFAGPAIVATLPQDTPIIKAMKTFVRGADRLGNVWVSVSPQPFGDEKAQAGTVAFGPSDSDFVVRGNRGTARLDTLTTTRVAVSRRTVTTNAAGNVGSVVQARPPLAVGEEAALFDDGWFAVARLGPYRVDWIAPDGHVNPGRPIPYTPIRATGAEKEAYFARQEASRAASRTASGVTIPPAMQRQIDALRDQFPDEFPPFTNGVIAGGDDRLWLRHPVSKEYLDYRYDIVDRRGQLVALVSLGKGERVVAVTKTAVYIAWKDEDDIERLRRHPQVP